MPQLPPLVYMVRMAPPLSEVARGLVLLHDFFWLIPFRFQFDACQFLRNKRLYAPKRIETHGCPKTHKCEPIENIRVHRCNTILDLKINNPKQYMIGLTRHDPKQGFGGEEQLTFLGFPMFVIVLLVLFKKKYRTDQKKMGDDFSTPLCHIFYHLHSIFMQLKVECKW